MSTGKDIRFIAEIQLNGERMKTSKDLAETLRFLADSIEAKETVESAMESIDQHRLIEVAHREPITDSAGESVGEISIQEY